MLTSRSSSWHHGHSRSPHGGDAALLDLALRREKTARQLLQSAIQLEASTVSSDLSASYLAWANCIEPLPLADLPPELYLELHDYSDVSLQQLPMPDPCPPPVTKWLPRLTQPLPPESFVPTTLQDLITPAAQSQIAQWVLQQLKFLLDIEARGSAAMD